MVYVSHDVAELRQLATQIVIAAGDLLRQQAGTIARRRQADHAPPSMPGPRAGARAR